MKHVSGRYFPGRKFCNVCYIFIRRKNDKEQEKSQTHIKKKQIENPKMHNQKKLPVDLDKKRKQRKSFSPTYPLTSVRVETIKRRKRFNENDINPLVD